MNGACVVVVVVVVVVVGLITTIRSGKGVAALLLHEIQQESLTRIVAMKTGCVAQHR